LKANKNGVVVIRQTTTSNAMKGKSKTPSAEDMRGNRAGTVPFNKLVNEPKGHPEQKEFRLRSSKSKTKPEILSKAKSFHELSDLTPPRSPVLPTR